MMLHNESVEIHCTIEYVDQQIHVQVNNEDFEWNHKLQLGIQLNE